MSLPDQPIRILFVVGAGRSGTTLINTILGQVPGVQAVGEVRYIWERGFGANHKCGCGKPFDSCEVWSDVVERATVDGPLPDPDEVSTDLLARLRILRTPWMVLREALGRPTVPYHRHDAAIHRLYRAVADRPGTQVIVDSSKLPPYGKLLERLPGVELTALHVVRDPRANAYSWQRVKQTHDTDDGATMERLAPWRSSLVWVAWSTLIGYWWPRSDRRHLTVRYEDFVAEPVATMTRVVEQIGLDPSTLPFLDSHTVTIAPTHTVAGNPNRHDRGSVRLRPDDEWQQKMPRRQKLFVTALTFPLLRRFGYPVKS